MLRFLVIPTVSALLFCSSSKEPKEYYKTFEISAYCSCKKCCGKHGIGVTASGKIATGRMIAAPKKYSFGTRIDIPGMGLYTVEDRGGAIKAAGVTLKKGMYVGRDPVPVRTLQYDRLDVLMPSHKQALKFGCKVIKCRVIRK
jgi:3D (Asp-Asp-Asp) domain-containing protein